jgi:hypothetical protein
MGGVGRGGRKFYIIYSKGGGRLREEDMGSVMGYMDMNGKKIKDG